MNTLTKYTCDDKVSKAIDTVLRKIFGDESTLTIYKYLEKRYSLSQDEIVEKIDVFAKGLEEFLRSGAYVIEQKILENVYSNYDLPRRLESERSEYDFVSQMKMLLQKT